MIVTYCPRCPNAFEIDVEDTHATCGRCGHHWNLSDDSQFPDDGPDPDYGGAFDGFNVSSDADPGL